MHKVLLKKDRQGKVYLSGPMTGLPNYNFDFFNEVADKLRAQGIEVENPADHGLVDGATREDYLRYDIARLTECESVLLLPGWEKSEGAKFEVQVAMALKMPINYYTQ